MNDPRGNVTTSSYDSANRLASVTTPKGEKTTYTYDTNGNLATVVDPRGNVQGGNPADYATTYRYDAAGRELSETDPLGHVTSYAYDTVGNRTSVTDANNHSTSYSYDAAGRILTVTAPDTGVTSYSYDPNGNQLSRTDANGHVTSYAYDAANRLSSITGPDPDGAGPLIAPVTTRAYDANGNLVSTVDPNGNATQTSGDGTTSYSYDHANRLKTITYSDSTPSVTYNYDAVGNRSSMIDGAGTQSYGYDNLDRLTSVSRGTDIFTYAYDAASNLTSRTYPDNTSTSYTYDEDNRLASAASNGASTSYAYDPASHLTQTTLPASNGYVETRTYDKAGRLTEVKNTNASSTLSDYAATLDPVGNPTTISQTGAVNSTTTYGYDASDRLTSVCFQTSCPGSNDPYISWTYDHVGNRLTETRPTGTTNYTYNSTDELTAVGSTNYTYDANGNELSDGSRTYTYDLASRLSSTTSSSTTTTYSYDGDGNRLQASTGAQPAQKTNSLWDTSGSLPQLALERDGNNTLLRRYAYGIRRISMSSGGNAFYYHYDLLGSVANLTSGTGLSEWTYGYDPFGTTRTAIQNDPSAPTNLMQFAGEYNDSSGLYNLRARQYDPAIGRMLTVDPATLAVDQPLRGAYVYVGDRPTIAVDPSGMTAQPAESASTGTDAAKWTLSTADNSYHYVYDLGTLGAPQSLCRYTRYFCSKLFPISGCIDDFKLGQDLHLHGNLRFGAFLPFPVRVVSLTAMSFTFRALPGHPEGNGRLITFSFDHKGGREELRVDTSSNGSLLTSVPGIKQIDFWLAKKTWAEFADRIRVNYYVSATDGAPQGLPT